MRVQSLVVTCECCPAQLEGMTDDGLYIYARARSGNMHIGIAPDMHDAVVDTDKTRYSLHGRFATDGLGSCCTTHLRALVELFVSMLECPL